MRRTVLPLFAFCAALAIPLLAADDAAPRARIWDLVRVVDGDTIVVRAEDATDPEATESVRMLCVDTEESVTFEGQSASKPKTAFGVYTSGWAKGWFAPLEDETLPQKVELVREEGGAERDGFGRLLAYVWFRGENYCLKLVREGWSPYYNKYGNSLLYHDQFVEAQELARAEQLGIWDPATNADGPKRPYDDLLAWWNARAEAIDGFRTYDAEHPNAVLDIETDLDEIRDRCAAGRDLTVFGAVTSTLEMRGGHMRVHFDTPEDKRFILFCRQENLGALEPAGLNGPVEEFQRNFIYVTGRGEMYRDSAEIVITSADQISTEPPGE